MTALVRKSVRCSWQKSEYVYRAVDSRKLSSVVVSGKGDIIIDGGGVDNESVETTAPAGVMVTGGAAGASGEDVCGGNGNLTA